MKETIKHAAVKTACGEHIYTGKCHAHCFRDGHSQSVRMSQKAEDQGFITSRGEFVSRNEAAQIAFDAGMTDERKKFLFSEDLWSPEENGKYDYDKEKGYYLK